MKKVLFIAAVAIVSLASCKKDRTCTCTTTSTLSGATAKPATVTDYPKSKKSAAKPACAAGVSANANALGRRLIWSETEHFDAVAGPPAVPAYTETTTCELK